MGNQRVFYACQGLIYNDQALAGVQTVSINTKNTQHPVESWGSFSIPAVYTDLPNVSISISRVISSGNLITTIPPTSDGNTLCLLIGSDSEDFVGDDIMQKIYFSHLHLNNISYNFDIDNVFTEEAEFVGFHKEFNPNSGCEFGAISGLPLFANVYTRQHLNVSSGNFGSYISPGSNITNISINVPYNVNFVQEFGKRLNRYDKSYTFIPGPVVSELSITVLYQAYDFDGYEIYYSGEICDCAACSGLDQSENISFSLCGGRNFRLNNCSLQNIDYNGGGADGSNSLITYKYACYNGFLAY